MGGKRIPDEVKARAIELGRRHMGQAQIVETLIAEGLVETIAQPTVSKILRAADVGKRRRATSRRPAVEAPAVERAESAGDDVDDVWPHRGGGDELAAIDADLADIDRAMKLALIDKQSSAYANLAKLKTQLLKNRKELIPPIPPDPADDPANTKARDAVRERLARMAKAHRCPSCGAPTVAT